jgi:ribosome-binding ATPase YchF (GTP1/OBG family)
MSCPGSGYIVQPMTQSVLCYCGTTFRRKLKSIHSWTIPAHSSNMKGEYNIHHHLKNGNIREEVISNP